MNMSYWRSSTHIGAEKRFPLSVVIMFGKQQHYLVFQLDINGHGDFRLLTEIYEV